MAINLDGLRKPGQSPWYDLWDLLLNQVVSNGNIALDNQAEVKAARDGELSLLSQIDDLQARISQLEAGVVGGTYTYDPTRVLDAAGFRRNAVNKKASTSYMHRGILYDTGQDQDGGDWRYRARGSLYESYGLLPQRMLISLSETLHTVEIYDADNPALPLIISYARGGAAGSENLIGGSADILRDITASNGMIYIATIGAGLVTLDLLLDVGTTQNGKLYRGRLTEGNDGLGTGAVVSEPLWSDQVRYVSARWYEGGADWPGRSLPRPTVMVSFSAGAQIVQSSGALASGSNGGIHFATAFGDDGTLWMSSGSSGNYFYYYRDITAAIDGWTWSLVRPSSFNDLDSGVGSFNGDGVATEGRRIWALQTTGLVGLMDGQVLKQKAVVKITKEYNSGWMYGDMYICSMSDVDEGILTDADVIPDRSLAGLNISIPAGKSVTKSPVAAGANLMWHTSNADLTATLGADITVAGQLEWWELVGGISVLYTYSFTDLQGFVDGYPGAVSSNVTVVGTLLTIKSGVSVALVRATTTPTDSSQILERYADEFQLFQPNAQCTYNPAQAGVNSLGISVDPVTGRTHTVPPDYRTEFQRLLMVSSVFSNTGYMQAVSAVDGRVMEIGSQGVHLSTQQYRLF